MLLIRKAKKSDLAILARIYKNTYDATKSGEKWDARKAKELLQFYYNLKTCIGLTAVYDKKICGAFFSYKKPWWDGSRLAGLLPSPKKKNTELDIISLTCYVYSIFSDF